MGPLCILPVKQGSQIGSGFVYSAGIGTVNFDPVVNGRPGKPLSFTNVLHIPDLRSNLLSVLYLTRNKGFTMHIHKSVMRFCKGRTTLFTASISERNAAYLNGQVVPVVPVHSRSGTIC